MDSIPFPSSASSSSSVWHGADGLINDRRGRSGVARSCSVASVKPVFAQATLGTWALIPRHVLEDSRFASLTVDTQRANMEERENRAQKRFARLGGHWHRGESRRGRSWGRASGAGLLFPRSPASCHSSDPVPSFLGVQRSRSTDTRKKYHPVDA